MKNYRILGFDIRLFFSIRRVKRLTIDLPEWSGDVCVTSTDANGDPMPHKIKYYKCSQRFYIDLPKCSDAIKVDLTPRYCSINGVRSNVKDRKIVVDIFF